MDFKRLLEPKIKTFIREHEGADIKALALKKPPEENWPYPLIIDQIKARQKAKIKLPLWLTEDDVIFPPGDILEQASSIATARYKASLFSGEKFIDLTGGAGIDFWAISENFKNSICIEHNPDAAKLIAHNMNFFKRKSVDVFEKSAEKFIAETDRTHLIYIDPQRRDNARKGMFKLNDCTPNVIELLPALKEKSSTVMIKTSPMLDIAQAIQDLKYVHEIHIVEWRGDCKEVLYILKFEHEIKTDQVPHICVKLNDEGEAINTLHFTKAEEEENAPLHMPQKYLYEPGPAFQKAGGFNALANQLKLKKLHKHTHLYTSETLKPGFPGRTFKILETLPVNRKALSLDKANLTIRNFPGDVASLRKKLKLKDGGNDYLFACTLADEQKALLHCRKTKNN